MLDRVKWFLASGCAVITHETEDTVHFELISLDWQPSISRCSSEFNNWVTPCSAWKEYFSGSVSAFQEKAFWRHFDSQSLLQHKADVRGKMEIDNL